MLCIYCFLAGSWCAACMVYGFMAWLDRHATGTTGLFASIGKALGCRRY